MPRRLACGVGFVKFPVRSGWDRLNILWRPAPGFFPQPSDFMKLLPVFLTTTTLAALAVPVHAAPDTPNPGLKYYYPVPQADPAVVIEADVCVFGGTPGGVAAAVQAARMGKKAVLVVVRRHVGGMTSGGLTATDVGKRAAIGGLANEVYERIGRTVGFRPSEAEAAFQALLQEAGVTIYYEHRLKEVVKEGGRITAITFENGNSARAKVYVDSTYEGDLLAKAGVSYHVGREANVTYGETINGIQFRNAHNFNAKVDPYVKPGDPESGLLPGISAADPGKQGEGDKKIQAYNFRMWLSDAEDRRSFAKPEGYDRGRYAVLARYLKAQTRETVPFGLRRGDCNNKGGFSTDNIGMNYGWPEAGYAEREKMFQDHVNYQQGLMWFTQHDEEVPEGIRRQVAAFGPDGAEFPETGGWPHELYVREGRRMVSEYVMTELECRGTKVVPDPIGLASYTMDSHNCQRVVIDGAVRNEGDVQVGVPGPYGISYRSIVPREAECGNLLVSVCLSSSHIAYGSIRMEPVFMVLGQTAGTAASMAIDAGVAVQRVEYAKLKERLLADKQVLVWDGPVRKPEPPLPAGGVQVEETKAKVTGAWSRSKAGFLHDGNEDKGGKSITYSPNLPAAGKYDVFLKSHPNPNRATETLVKITHATGTATVKVDQRTAEGWVKIHTAEFKNGKASPLVISNEGTSGHVIADGVRWVPVE